LEARCKEWNSLENGYHSQLSEKDAEIRHLLLQVDLASQSNVEEVAHTRQLIQESMREMEAHKAKRLAARNEMITLAKVGSDADIGCRCNMCTVVPQSLERAQADGDEVKAQLQFVLGPMVAEQVIGASVTCRTVVHIRHLLHVVCGPCRPVDWRTWFATWKRWPST
jgi:hypothetical protein